MAAAEEKARLLRILEGHGQSFMDSFQIPTLGESSKKKRKADKVEIESNKKAKKAEIEVVDQEEVEEEEEEEEWFGIGSGNGNGNDRDENDSCSEGSDDDGEEDGSEFEHSDNEFTSAEVDSKVVVFADPSTKRTEVDDMSRVQMKAFMSSKISKISSNSQDPTVIKKNKEEEEEDKTNAQNDALLHKLVHTKLLSGSLDPNLDLTPAQRRKALAGRVLELTGSAKMGKGEKQVRDAEKRKASKQVREGLSSKQSERNVQQLEEAKNLGNYHPTLKKVFEASGGPTARKREKGLKMGVGNFKHGALRLGRDDIDMAQGGGFRSGATRGSRGGRGGRGRGRGGSGGRDKRK